MEKLHLAFD